MKIEIVQNFENTNMYEIYSLLLMVRFRFGFFFFKPNLDNLLFCSIAQIIMIMARSTIQILLIVVYANFGKAIVNEIKY